jgi:6-phosphofructokinase 1
VVLSAENRGWKCYGIQRGYDGLLTFNGVVPLGPEQVRGITHLGGTILGTSNRGNPFRFVTRSADGTEQESDRSAELVAAFQASGFDALVAIERCALSGSTPRCEPPPKPWISSTPPPRVTSGSWWWK